jgi:nicotinate-nucleotide adenylyltransferase
VGHLRLAEEVVSRHGLDRVVFIPCFIPPHKTSDDIAPAEHRLAMTRLACSDNPLFETSDMEVGRAETSYTVDTLERFHASADDCYFIMGTDSLGEIHTWKDFERLFELSNFIVVPRPGRDFDSAWAEVPYAARARFEVRHRRLEHDSGHVLIPSPVEGLNVSSTRIRAFRRAGTSIRYLVPDTVVDYINAYSLYRSMPS